MRTSLKVQVFQHSRELPLPFKKNFKQQLTALLFIKFLLIFKTDSITYTAHPAQHSKMQCQSQQAKESVQAAAPSGTLLPPATAFALNPSACSPPLCRRDDEYPVPHRQLSPATSGPPTLALSAGSAALAAAQHEATWETSRD